MELPAQGKGPQLPFPVPAPLKAVLLDVELPLSLGALWLALFHGSSGLLADFHQQLGDLDIRVAPWRLKGGLAVWWVLNGWALGLAGWGGVPAGWVVGWVLGGVSSKWRAAQRGAAYTERNVSQPSWGLCCQPFLAATDHGWCQRSRIAVPCPCRCVLCYCR